MKSFDQCKKLFDNDQLDKLSQNPAGLLWLKLRSITRKEILNGFCREKYPRLIGKNMSEQFSLLYTGMLPNIKEAHTTIDSYIRSVQPAHTQHEIEKIASELHKMRHFSWGGDYSNALDRFLVDRYIKAYNSYAMIDKMLQTEISVAVSDYVKCSWYNHWSSILIENLFRQHNNVLPALGNIKKIDFFIHDIPFDLKMTYLPANYVKQQRKIAGLQDELAELKSTAKTHNIAFDSAAKPKSIAYEIAERIKTSGNRESKRVLEAHRNFREKTIKKCMQNSKSLLLNLYQEQGEMRFDASNRLFLILADTNEFDDSWKLKRNPQLLKKYINAYLDNFSRKKVKKIKFTHRAKSGSFIARADAIFVIV